MSAAKDIRLVDVWRRDNAKVAADAIALWKRLGALPPDLVPQERAAELCAAAYLGDEIIGVSTIRLGLLPQLRVRFGFFRCLVAPEHRRSGVARTLAVTSFRYLEAWAKDHPHEEVLGMAAVLENPNIDIKRLPVWPETKLTLIGYTPDGRQIRAAWFEHASLGSAIVPGGEQVRPHEEPALVTAWQKHDPGVVAQAVALWNRLGVMPHGTLAEDRARELCSAAYIGGELAGVSTILLETYPPLGGRFGFFRCLVAPEFRQQGVAASLGIHSRHVLGGWSKDNPQEKILGMAAVVESPKLDALAKRPVWHAPGINGLMLIGYTAAGYQMRVSWFEHARLD